MDFLIPLNGSVHARHHNHLARVIHTHSDMVLGLKRAVSNGLSVSVIEGIEGSNILDRSCTCKNAFSRSLQFGDIKAYEDSVCSLNQCYE